MYWYFLVLKKTIDLENDLTKQYYMGVIQQVLKCPIIGYHTFEYDSKNILHCNYVFCQNKKLEYSDLVLKGCHFNCDVISNKLEMFKIMKYIHKDYILKSESEPVDHSTKSSRAIALADLILKYVG